MIFVKNLSKGDVIKKNLGIKLPKIKKNLIEHFLTFQFELVRNIPSAYVTSTLWVKQGSTQLLAMASVDHWPKRGEDCLEFLSGGQVDIYTYKTKEIRWIRSIPLKGVVSMITFDIEGMYDYCIEFH